METYKLKDSGIEWLGSIPVHWKVDRIKDVTTKVIGGDWGSDLDSSADGEAVIVLRVADINGIYFNYDSLTYRKIKSNSIFSRELHDNCLVIEKSGGVKNNLLAELLFLSALIRKP